MKVTEHLARAGSPPISFEIIPPLRGGNIRSLMALIEDLVQFRPPFIDITSHAAEVVYEETARRHPAPGQAQAAGHARRLRADPEQVADRRRAARALPGLHARGDRGLPDRAALPRHRQRARGARRRERVPEAAARRQDRQRVRGRPGAPGPGHEPRPLPRDRPARRRAVATSASGSPAIPRSTSRRPTSRPTSGAPRRRSTPAPPTSSPRCSSTTGATSTTSRSAGRRASRRRSSRASKILTAKAQLASIPRNFYVDIPAGALRRGERGRPTSACSKSASSGRSPRPRSCSRAASPSLHFYVMSSSTAVKKVMARLKVAVG